jgi:hypothetical protein
MAKHEFVAGDRVEVRPNPLNAHVRPGIYTITRLMPVTTQGCQYRAKNVLDSHERVLDEAQLRRIEG